MATEFAGLRNSERQRGVGTLVLSFTSDPFVRWLYPEASHYLTNFPEVVQAFGGAAFTDETAWRLGDFAAVALWLRPGVEPDGDAVIGRVKSNVASEKFEDLVAVLGLLDDAHPQTSHWYLPWFGVDSAMQGQGLGTVLLGRCLEILDKDHLPSYLDSTNPRNVPFYERHGFEVTVESRAGASPPIVSMLRSPR